MCSGLSFLVGLFLVFKGSFRVGNRLIPPQQGRIAGVILMAPLVIGLCAGSVLLANTINAGGDTLTVDALMNDPALAQVTLVELGSLVVALALTAYVIFSQPTSSGSSRLEQAPEPDKKSVGSFMPRPAAPRPPPAAPAVPPVRAAPPEIMTVEQAAAYLGVPPDEVIRLIESSQLGAVRSGGAYIIAKSALDDYQGRA